MSRDTPEFLQQRPGSWNVKRLLLSKKGYKLTYLQNRNRVTDVENKLMVTGVGWEG